jgi:hypothetical protein
MNFRIQSSCMAYVSILKMEALCSPEIYHTSTKIHGVTLRKMVLFSEVAAQRVTYIATSHVVTK